MGYFLLLVMLLLWGVEPWEFSGFYHIDVLDHVLAYPSACAFWVSLLLLARNGKRVADGNQRLLIFTIPLISFVLLIVVRRKARVRAASAGVHLASRTARATIGRSAVPRRPDQSGGLEAILRKYRASYVFAQRREPSIRHACRTTRWKR